MEREREREGKEGRRFGFSESTCLLAETRHGMEGIRCSVLFSIHTCILMKLHTYHACMPAYTMSSQVLPTGSPSFHDRRLGTGTGTSTCKTQKQPNNGTHNYLHKHHTTEKGAQIPSLTFWMGIRTNMIRPFREFPVPTLISPPNSRVLTSSLQRTSRLKTAC